MPGQSVRDQVRAVIDAAFPGHQGATVIVKVGEGIEQRVRVPAAPPRAAFVPADDGLDDTDRDIVEAATEAGVRLSADELAAKSGYDLNGRFRERLAWLVRQGLLVNRRPGYECPDNPAP